MTTIAWDGRTLAVDRAITTGRVMTPTCKLRPCFEPANGWPPGMFAHAGNLGFGEQFHQWILGKAERLPPENPTDLDQQAGLYVTQDGACFLVINRGLIVRGADLETDGAGFEFAYACLICGKTAREALELTTIHTSAAALGIDTWIPGAPWP